jgi:hypothetical protein
VEEQKDAMIVQQLLLICDISKNEKIENFESELAECCFLQMKRKKKEKNESTCVHFGCI